MRSLSKESLYAVESVLRYRPTHVHQASSFEDATEHVAAIPCQIDGIWIHVPEQPRLLCRNHHALTLTFL